METLRKESEDNADGFLIRKKLHFSWWIHGGEPGPEYKSDALEINLLKNGENKIIYSRTLFDFKPEPHYSVEKFEGHTEMIQIQSLIKNMVNTKLFDQEFKEEKDPEVGGILKETWEFDQDTIKNIKTFFEPFPPQINSLRDLCENLIKKTIKTGSRTIQRPR